LRLEAWSVTLRLGSFDNEVSAHELNVRASDSLVDTFFSIEGDEGNTLRASVFILEEVDSADRSEVFFEEVSDVIFVSLETESLNDHFVRLLITRGFLSIRLGVFLVSVRSFFSLFLI